MRTRSHVRWLRLLRREQDSRAAALRSAGKSDTGVWLRHWWSTINELLKEYSRSIASHVIHEPPPAEVVEVLAELAGELAVGRIPEPIRKAASEGRTRPTPRERRTIGMAVVYWCACQPEGIEHNGVRIMIDDPDPVEHIHLWFGAHKRTIQDWIKKHPPVFLGVNDVNADTIRHLTIQAARQYRDRGRSHAAIRTRNAKRRAGAN
jgi:hypothetical protein